MTKKVSNEKANQIIVCLFVPLRFCASALKIPYRRDARTQSLRKEELKEYLGNFYRVLNSRSPGVKKQSWIIKR